MKRSSGMLVLTSAACGVIGVAGLVMSSALAADTPANTESSSSESLGEIVVTAAKFSVDVMHAPISLTAINGDTLERNEIHQVTELQFYVPGLTASNTIAGVSLNIRGIGSTFVSPNISQ